MNNLLTPNLLNREPFATNPVYLKKVNICCPFCVHPGRKKVYTNLWCYHMHLRTHHSSEKEISELTRNLADYIIRGILP